MQQHGSLDDDDTDELDDDMLMMDESPDVDDDGSESGDRVIYPWMKKIHVAGVGKFQSVIFPLTKLLTCFSPKSPGIR